MVRSMNRGLRWKTTSEPLTKSTLNLNKHHINTKNTDSSKHNLTRKRFITSWRDFNLVCHAIRRWQMFDFSSRRFSFSSGHSYLSAPGRGSPTIVITSFGKIPAWRWRSYGSTWNLQHKPGQHSTFDVTYIYAFILRHTESTTENTVRGHMQILLLILLKHYCKKLKGRIWSFLKWRSVKLKVCRDVSQGARRNKSSSVRLVAIQTRALLSKQHIGEKRHNSFTCLHDTLRLVHQGLPSRTTAVWLSRHHDGAAEWISRVGGNRWIDHHS